MLRCMANLIQTMAGPDVVVRYAHMELADPDIAGGFTSCVQGGAPEVIVFPYMLSPGATRPPTFREWSATWRKAFRRHLHRHPGVSACDEKLAELVARVLSRRYPLKLRPCQLTDPIDIRR